MYAVGDPQIALFMAHLACAAFMTGSIWVVQLILYPAFAQINSKQFHFFHQNHSQKITFIVGPVMLLELITAAALVYFSQFSVFFVFNFLAVILIWCCTGFLSVPIHALLEKEQNLEKIDRLVQTNWPRTLLWSFRTTALLSYFFILSGVLNVHI